MEFRRFFIKILLIVILPAVIFLGGYEYLYRQVENPYSLKDRVLTENAASIEVLILGSSHMFYGVNPQYMSVESFNAANISQDYHYDTYIFEKYATRMPHLTCVVMSVSYFSPWEKLEDEVDNWLLRKYRIYMGDSLVPMYVPAWNWEFMALGGGKNIAKIVRGEELVPCNSYGYGTGYEHTPEVMNWEKHGADRATLHALFNRYDQRTIAHNERENLQHLQNIIDYCEDNHIRIILVTPPAHEAYYSQLDTAQYRAVVDFANNLSRSSDVVEYHNFLMDNRFVEHDFYDSDHLNAQGAEKFTRIIDALLSAPYKP